MSNQGFKFGNAIAQCGKMRSSTIAARSIAICREVEYLGVYRNNISEADQSIRRVVACWKYAHTAALLQASSNTAGRANALTGHDSVTN